MASVDPAAQAGDPRVTIRPLVVLGGGEHARVVIDAAAGSGAWRVEGFTDPGPADDTERVLGVPRLGADDAVIGEPAVGVSGEGRWLVLGIGLPGGSVARRTLVERARDAAWATVVHPSATVAGTASVGAGTVILARAVINPGAVVGSHAILNTGVIVEHDVVVGDRAHIGPGAVLGGGAEVGQDAFVGLGALVRDHVRVGAGATVGMGAVVVGDVPPGATVLGNPARAVRGG